MGPRPRPARRPRRRPRQHWHHGRCQPRRGPRACQPRTLRPRRRPLPSPRRPAIRHLPARPEGGGRAMLGGADCRK
ncbi:MAG: hypothetical protein DWI01_05605 [Planctomycetota bacterium]|nr:MAG: hypothetical protein DWI01_05605 [Planctomycetota bacterium]